MPLLSHFTCKELWMSSLDREILKQNSVLKMERLQFAAMFKLCHVTRFPSRDRERVSVDLYWPVWQSVILYLQRYSTTSWTSQKERKKNRQNSLRNNVNTFHMQTEHNASMNWTRPPQMTLVMGISFTKQNNAGFNACVPSLASAGAIYERSLFLLRKMSKLLCLFVMKNKQTK